MPPDHLIVTAKQNNQLCIRSGRWHRVGQPRHIGGSRLLPDRSASPASAYRIVGGGSVRRPTAGTAGQRCYSRCPLPGGSGDVGGDYISGVPVHAAAGPVISHRGPWVGVRCRFLNIAQRDSGIQRCGNERVPERMRRNGFGDPGTAGGLADEPPGAMPVQPPPVRGQEHRPAGALADSQVNGPGGARAEW